MLELYQHGKIVMNFGAKNENGIKGLKRISLGPMILVIQLVCKLMFKKVYECIIII